MQYALILFLALLILNIFYILLVNYFVFFFDIMLIYIPLIPRLIKMMTIDDIVKLFIYSYQRRFSGDISPSILFL